MQLPGVRKSEVVHVERMKKFVDLTAPASSEEGAESSVEWTVDFEIQKKVSWADEMDQRTGRKETEDEESGLDDKERAKRITRGEWAECGSDGTGWTAGKSTHRSGAGAVGGRKRRDGASGASIPIKGEETAVRTPQICIVYGLSCLGIGRWRSNRGREDRQCHLCLCCRC